MRSPEPETRAITEFVRKEQFDMLLAFHSQGREIYYDFDGMTGENSVEIAKKNGGGKRICGVYSDRYGVIRRL